MAREYLALEGGPPCFPQDFPCPVVLRLIRSSAVTTVAYGALTRYGAVSHQLPLSSRSPDASPHEEDAHGLQPRLNNPKVAQIGLGSSRFARHYSGSLV